MARGASAQIALLKKKGSNKTARIAARRTILTAMRNQPAASTARCAITSTRLAR